MPPKRKRLISSAEELADRTAFLRTELQTYEDALHRFIGHLYAGETAVTSARNVNVPLYRQSVTEALETFETTRRQMRLAMLSLGQEEGASISELGRSIGVSRQLASRLAAEAAEEEDR
jgi:hypothetical protein